MTKPKHPPCSSESEMIILGSMLNSANSLNICIDYLEEADFYFLQNSKLFTVMKNLRKKGSSVDTLLVTEETTRAGLLQEIGGIDYLLQVSNFSQPFAHLEEYISIVKNKSQLRQIILAAQNAEMVAIKEPDNILDTLDDIQKSFFEIGKGSLSSDFKYIKNIIDGSKSEKGMSFVDLIQDYQEKVAAGIDPTLIAGVPTGFIDLDKIIGGLGNSNLIILAARPAMGKTTLALNILLNASFRTETPVGLFSLEMGADQLLWKLCGCHAEINTESVKKKMLNPLEFQSLVNSAGLLSQQTIILEDPPKITINQLKSRARRMKEVENIGLLIIDYLQLISSSQKSNNRQEEVSMISRELKGLARELNIPILCLAQLSRKVEERESKKPIMSDLRESGAIEQDSDVILFIHRRDYHDKMDKPGLAEIIVGKNRHGEIGIATLAFEMNIGKFRDCTFRLPDDEDDKYEKQFNDKLKGYI